MYKYAKIVSRKDLHIVRFAFDSAEDLERIGKNPVELQRKNRKDFSQRKKIEHHAEYCIEIHRMSGRCLFD